MDNEYQILPVREASLAYLQAKSKCRRKCLGCGEYFKSAHSGNRLCSRCKDRMRNNRPLPHGAVF